MKKILIAVAIGASVVVANAASYQWKIGTTAICDAGTTVATTASTVYLFNATDYTQQQVIDAVVAGSFDSSKAVASAALTSGKFNTYTDLASAGTVSGGYINEYFAVINGGSVFVSATKAIEVMADPDVTMISFTGYANATKAAAFDASTKTFAAGGAGWYAGSPVPEPTSGLLLLLGMAGLALKRKLV